MTKEEIISRVSNSTDKVTNKKARETVELTFKIIKDALARGENVELRTFGNFRVRHKKPRVGRNPRTGEEARITERNVVTFRASKIFKQALID